jgi:hypothetical protein
MSDRVKKKLRAKRKKAERLAVAKAIDENGHHAKEQKQKPKKQKSRK